MYTVNLWGSHPSENNDDCWDGDEFENEQQAMAVYQNPGLVFPNELIKDTAYIELQLVEESVTRKNRDYNPEQDYKEYKTREGIFDNEYSF